MINLKEAGRFSNYFSQKLNELNGIHYHIAPKLSTKTEVHKISASLKEEKDETKEVVIEGTYDVSLETVEGLIKTLLSEKIKLSNAIAKAKSEMLVVVGDETLAFDTAIEYSKSLRDISGGLYRALENMKESVLEKKGIGKTFNVEGNQIPYEYPIEVTTKLSFDKAEIKKSNKTMKDLANKLSVEIEEASSRKVIDFDSKFDYLDTLEELFEKFSA